MGSLVGWRLWGRTESDTTEATEHQQQQLGRTPGWEVLNPNLGHVTVTSSNKYNKFYYSRFSRETEEILECTHTHTHTCRCIYKRRFIMGMGSRGYRDWEVPPSAAYKLETGKLVVQISLGPKAWESRKRASGGSPSLGLNVPNRELWCLRAEGRCGNSSREGEFTLSSPFCSIQALSGSGDSSCIAEGDLPYSISESNANFFPKHPRKHTQK